MAAAAKSLQLQSSLILCYPIDGGPTGSPVPVILHARTLQWVTISSSNAWKWKVKVKSFSPVWLLATPWTAAYQALLSMGFSRQKYWSGVPLPSPEGNDRTHLSDERKKLTVQITVPIKDLIQIWKRNQKLYRQAKAETIQHHQTRSSTNAKGSSLDRKHRKGV